MHYLSDIESDYRLLEKYLNTGALGVDFNKPLKRHLNSQNSSNQSTAFNHLAKIQGLSKITAQVSNTPIDIPTSKVLPTRFDHANFYFILENLTKEIMETVAEFKFPLNKFPNYACIPTGKFCAYALSLKGAKKDFILFDSHVFLFFYLFSKLFSNCIPLEGNDLSFRSEAVDQHLKRNPQAVDDMIELLATYATGGEISNCRQLPIDEKRIGLVHLLCTTMELSVIGHEFGHIWLGHLRAGEFVSPISNTPQDVRRQELEADFAAAIITGHCMMKKNEEMGLVVMGLDLAFISIALCNLVWEMIGFIDKKSIMEAINETHPSTKERRENIKKYISECYNDQNMKEYLLGAIKYSSDSSNVIYQHIKNRINKHSIFTNFVRN